MSRHDLSSQSFPCISDAVVDHRCQSWDGGTRTAAFVAGGLVPATLHGTTNDALFHVTDWYHTLCKVRPRPHSSEPRMPAV